MTRPPLRAGVAALVVAGIVMASAAPAAASPANEVSDAMRYGASAPLGEVIDDLIDEDDSTYTVAAPWPLNFFGEKYDGLCITTNGGVYPVIDDTEGCSNSYDENVENLADSSNAPMIAVLAADTDLGECDEARVAQRDGSGDGFGRPCTIYLDTEATIDGRDAVVITWYRVSQYEGENDETLENTYQLLLIKLPTVDGDTVGYDFDFEFNYGTLRDGEDGYSAEDPSDECESLTDDCRWGIGVADFEPDIVTSAPTESTETEPVATESTETETPLTESAATEPAATEPAAPESPATKESPAEEPATDERTTVQPVAATGYEFFAATKVADLLDNGATPLVANSLGTDVDGRYTCGMLSGQAVGCTAVQLLPPTPELAATGASDDLIPASLVAMLVAFTLVGAGVVLASRANARGAHVRA